MLAVKGGLRAVGVGAEAARYERCMVPLCNLACFRRCCRTTAVATAVIGRGCKVDRFELTQLELRFDSGAELSCPSAHTISQ